MVLFIVIERPGTERVAKTGCWESVLITILGRLVGISVVGMVNTNSLSSSSVLLRKPVMKNADYDNTNYDNTGLP